MSPLSVGLILNSALYLVCIFVAALVRGDRLAMYAAIVTMGICYLSYAAQIMVPDNKRINGSLFIASVVSGLAAGVYLVTG